MDKNRTNRFYFTALKTSVRCYIIYEDNNVVVNVEDPNLININKPIVKNVKAKQSVFVKDKEGENNLLNDKFTNLNGRKLSPRSLQRLKLSNKFIEEAKDLVKFFYFSIRF